MASAGRPRIGKEKRIRATVMLDPAQHEFLKAFGGGNVSAALNLVVERYIKRHYAKYGVNGRKVAYRQPLPVPRVR